MGIDTGPSQNNVPSMVVLTVRTIIFKIFRRQNNHTCANFLRTSCPILLSMFFYVNIIMAKTLGTLTNSIEFTKNKKYKFVKLFQIMQSLNGFHHILLCFDESNKSVTVYSLHLKKNSKMIITLACITLALTLNLKKKQKKNRKSLVKKC